MPVGKAGFEHWLWRWVHTRARLNFQPCFYELCDWACYWAPLNLSFFIREMGRSCWVPLTGSRLRMSSTSCCGDNDVRGPGDRVGPQGCRGGFGADWEEFWLQTNLGLKSQPHSLLTV